MEPGVASIAWFFALVIFAVAVALPVIFGDVEDRLAFVGLGIGLALLGALFVWLAIAAQ